MIERFNLYDVYGYLLPGLAMIGLLWLPYGMVTKVWPPLELGSALFALVVGYMVGHVLHELSRWFFPSADVETIAGHKVLTFPSDRLLEDDDRTFSATMKKKIKEKIQKWYGIDANQRENRSAAFDMCRNELLQGDRASYAEQFQGLYALLRGLAGAALLAGVHLGGWAISVLIDGRWSFVAQTASLVSVVLFMAVCVGVEWCGEMKKLGSPWPARRFSFLALVLAVVGLTAGVASRSRMGDGLWAPFAMGAIGLVAVEYVCVGTYRSFSHSFARTVYRDFLVIEKTSRDGASSKKGSH